MRVNLTKVIVLCVLGFAILGCATSDFPEPTSLTLGAEPEPPAMAPSQTAGYYYHQTNPFLEVSAGTCDNSAQPGACY